MFCPRNLGCDCSETPSRPSVQLPHGTVSLQSTLMQRDRRIVNAMMIASLLLLSASSVRSAGVSQDIPVTSDVDIVVAGGGCGAVAAARSAAEAGAEVLLITSRNYLGEDVAGTMQLWLEQHEEPAGDLATELYSDPFFEDTPGLHYTYTADLPSESRHPDTSPPSLLRRNRPAMDPQNESVQYANDVTISVDLQEVVAVKEIAATAFRRAGDFEVQNTHVLISPDGESWQDLGDFDFELEKDRQEFTIPIPVPTRYVKLLFRRAPGTERILVGSVKFVGRDTVLPSRHRAVRPLHVKKTLESALQQANVPFLFGCYPTELLVDSNGRISGLVMANRMGRQAIRAKAVIDCTEHALLARLAGVKMRDPGDSEQLIRWVTISGEPTSADDMTVRKLPMPVTVFDLRARQVQDTEAAWYEYTFRQAGVDSMEARAELESSIRERCYNPTQFYSADMPLVIPGSSIVSNGRRRDGWDGPAAMPLSACEPTDTQGLWVLSGYTDVTREAAVQLMRPIPMLAIGKRLGESVAEAVSKNEVSQQLSVQALSGGAANRHGCIQEPLAGLRPRTDRNFVVDANSGLPILGRFDVVVVGGGTSGAPAGIAAARHGAKTLVLEHLHGLGGVGTLGMIGKYWFGNRVGFAADVPENPIEQRMHYYLTELRRAGAQVWFGALGCGAVTEGDQVKGVVVATPFGRGVIQAGIVIDGTGNADIAAAAGAETEFVHPFFALQMSHIPPREIGASYINGNRTPIDAADPINVTQAMLDFPDRAFDRGQIVDSRERRRIVGEYTLDWLDQLNHRTFTDSIAFGQSDYDSHGYQVHPYFMLRPARVPGEHYKQFYSYVPYRCLLPRKLRGILVVGLAISTHRDALPIVRMQPDLQNIGYAAGIAAAMTTRSGATLRDLDVEELQSHLVAAGILEAEVPAHEDSYPLNTDLLRKAVASLPSGYDGLGAVMANPAAALPMIREAYRGANDADQLAYAHVLGILGDEVGSQSLIEAAETCIAEGNFSIQKTADGMDRINQLMWALGRSGDPEATAALIALAEAGAVNSASRFRAVVVSLGAARSDAGAAVLNDLLKKEAGSNSVQEIMAACALMRCGDPQREARAVLQRMSQGQNGPFARLANAMLAE
jgi:hypothetical protein